MKSSSEETRAEVEESIDFACSSGIQLATFSFMTFYPGTNFWHTFKDSQQLSKDFTRYSLVSSISYVDPGRTKEEMDQLMKQAMRRFYLRPRKIAALASLVLGNPSQMLEIATGMARVGYPYILENALLSWAPGLLSAPFSLFLGPLGAYNLVMLLAPAFSGLAAYLFLRRASNASPWVAGAMSVIYGLCPYLLASLANGQIEKAQLWAYPLYLLLLGQALAGPRRRLSMLLIAPVMIAIIFTGPYFGLFIPLVAAPFALGHVVNAKGKRLKTAALALCALALTGAPLLLAQSYYQYAEGPSNFLPASAPVQMVGELQIFPSPVAQPKTTGCDPFSSAMGCMGEHPVKTIS